MMKGKAVLKQQQSRRFARLETQGNAKRLDCGWFTAAFPLTSKIILHFHTINLKPINRLHLRG